MVKALVHAEVMIALLGYEILTPVTMKGKFLWIITQCSLET
jgi:hypothetical protein